MITRSEEVVRVANKSNHHDDLQFHILHHVRVNADFYDIIVTPL